MAEALLAVRDLETHLHTRRGVIRAVDRVSFQVGAGQTLAILGESGCGKSMTALSIMRLVPAPAARIVGGEVRLRGRDLLRISEPAMRRVRGKEIAIVFQDPTSALNPVYSVGSQVVEAIRAHERVGRAEAAARAVELLRAVGVPSPEQRFHEYPHRLSGGMRQRAVLAMALACDPILLIADEPTTALDVTIQAQLLHVIRSLTRERGMAVVLITHDLGVAAQMAQRLVVMYAGQVVEEAPADGLYGAPLHPYTQGLLSAAALDGEKARLQAIRGQVPDLLHLPTGCRFHPRCPLAEAACAKEVPPLREARPDHWVRCWLRG